VGCAASRIWEARNDGALMQRVLFVVLMATTLVLSVVVGALLDDPQTSTVEIDRDRAAIADAIKSADEASERYSGGLLKALIDVRVSILRNTLAMLDQKRTASIRRIALDYTIEAKSVRPATGAELQAILEELSQAEKRVAASEAEAAKYSGGLMQSIALMKAETDELSVSQLRLKFYSAKHGLPVLPFNTTSTPDRTPPSAGTVVKDKDAL
jgi:hypothetical protein